MFIVLKLYVVNMFIIIYLFKLILIYLVKFWLMMLSDDEGGGEDECSVFRLYLKVWLFVLV